MWWYVGYSDIAPNKQIVVLLRTICQCPICPKCPKGISLNFQNQMHSRPLGHWGERLTLQHIFVSYEGKKSSPWDWDLRSDFPPWGRKYAWDEVSPLIQWIQCPVSQQINFFLKYWKFHIRNVPVCPAMSRFVPVCPAPKNVPFGKTGEQRDKSGTKRDIAGQSGTFVCWRRHFNMGLILKP